MKVRLERDDFQTRLHWTNDYGSFRRSHQPIQRHYSIVARRLCLLTLSLAKKYLYNLMSANNANPILRRLGIKGELSGGHFMGAACGLIQPLRAEHREVPKPATHVDPATIPSFK